MYDKKRLPQTSGPCKFLLEQLLFSKRLQSFFSFHIPLHSAYK